MTQSVLGSSLLSAQDDYSSHQPHIHNHHRIYNHPVRSHDTETFHRRRQETISSAPNSDVVKVIRTLSVVELLDSAGATVEVHTLTSEPTTTTSSVLAATAEVTAADVTAEDFSTLKEPAAAVASISNDVSESYSSIIPTTNNLSSVDGSSTGSSAPSLSTSFPTVESYATPTPTLSTSTPIPSTGYPSFSGMTNSTTTTASSSSTSLLSSTTDSALASLTAFGSIFNLTTSTLPSSTGTVLYNASFTTTLEPSETATSTGTNDGGFAGGAGNGGTADPTASTSTPSAGSGSGSGSGPGSGPNSSKTPAGIVTGSVLGAVAGVAFIVVIALMLLKWKKRQNAMKMRQGAPQGVITGGAGDGSGALERRNSPAMSSIAERGSERRSAPFAIPAALANLTGGYKRFSAGRSTVSSAEGGEKGFQKVSGRKLPSVFQHGGDGYTEPSNPHDSYLTDPTFYRDSQGFFAGPVAVGSPMRNSATVPVYHPGPARTPVAASSHYSENLEAPQRDALGRSHSSQDGSNRSHDSRFTEAI